MEAQLPDPAAAGPRPGRGAGTRATTPAAPEAARRVGETGEGAAGGGTAARPPVASQTPAARSAPRAPTAGAAAATQTVTVTTVTGGATGDTLNAPLTPSTIDAEAAGGGAPEDVTTLPRPRRTLALAHAATAAGRGTSGGTGAALGALAAGAAAAAPGRGDAATAAAQPAAPPAPPRAPLTGVVEAGGATGAGQTAPHGAETSTAPASTVPSPPALPHHEPQTATAAPRARGQGDPGEKEGETRGTLPHTSPPASFWIRSSPGRDLMSQPQGPSLAPRSRTHHRATLGPNCLQLWAISPCCPCSVSCRQGRNSLRSP